MLSCKEVVKTISSNDKRSWMRILEVRMHLMICHHCSTYAKHLKIMSSAVRSLLDSRRNDSGADAIKKIEDQVLKRVK